MVTVVMEKAERVWMVKRALVAPAGTVTVLGTLARLELLRSCTTTPPAGATSARFTIQTRSAFSITTVTITATYNGVSRSAQLTVWF